MSKVTDAAKDLPSDPEFALVTFSEKVNVYYNSITGGLTDNDAIFAIRFVRLFLQKFQIDIDVTFPIGGSLSVQAMNVLGQVLKERPRLIAKKVDAEIEDILVDYSIAQENTFGLARLNAEEKKKILDGLEKIRVVIEKSGLAERKRNALFERLADLISEVNTHGTRTDRFFAFAGDVAFVLGDMTVKAKPLLDEVKEVLRIISRSRARQEGISLPPGDEVFRLPSPDDNSD
jgi:hypothetical protein